MQSGKKSSFLKGLETQVNLKIAYKVLQIAYNVRMSFAIHE